MRRAEWLVERPWRLVVLVFLIAAPLLVIAEFAAGDTRRRVEAEQRENLRALAVRGADATASRTGTLLDKLVGAASTSRLKTGIGWTFRREPGGPRETIEAPDLRELSFQLDAFHAVMRDEVATLFALDGAGFVLETDPPGGTADGRIAVGRDLEKSAYATAVIADRSPRYVGVDPPTGSLVFAVPITQVLTQNPATQRTSRGTSAALVAEARPTFLEDSLRSLSASVQDLYVVDGQGRLLARLNRESQPLQDLSRHPAVAAALAGGPYLDRSSDPISNAPALIATAPVGVLGWHIVAVAHDDLLGSEIDAGLAQQRGLRVGLIAVLVLGAALVGGTSSAAIRQRREAADALERQTAVAQVLGEISQSAFDLGPVLETVIAHATRLCAAQQGFIYRRDGDVFRLAVSYGITPEFREFTETHPLSGTDLGTVTGRAVQRRTTVHVPDVLQDPEYTYWEAQKRGKFRALLGVPMIRDDAVIGVMNLWRSEPEPFTPEQIDLVTTFANQATIAIENMRLFNETKEALERQTSISDVLQTIGRSAFDLQPVLDTVVERAVKLCDAREGSISTLEGDVYRTRAYWSASALPPAYIEFMRQEARAPERASLTGRTALEGRVVHIADVLEDPEYTATDMQRAAGYRTLLGVPLLRDGRVIGVFALTRSEVRPFSDRQIELVRTFADQAAIAIENTRLFAATKEALEQQTAVGEVLKTISRSAFDLQPVLDIVLNNAVRLAGADIGWLSRVENGQFTTVAYSTEFPQAVKDELVRQRAEGHIAGPWIPLGTGGGLMGFTLAEGRMVHLPDVKADPELKGSVIARLTAARTVVGVPMLRDGRSIGGMVLARYDVRPFEQRELELVQTFADQAAIAIENVRLFNETKEALEQQTAVGEVLKTISRSTFDLDPVLATVVETAARLSDADLAWMGRFVQSGIQGSGDPVRWARDGDMSAFRRVDEVLRDPTESAVAGAPGTGGPGSIMARAFRERSTIQIDDITADDELLKESLIARMTGSRTVLAVPLLVEHAAIGTMLVARRTVRRFSEREVQVVETFADQAAIAIHNVRLFNEIQDKSRQLEIASRHKSEFLANMSHELRTPLNAIIGFSEVLAQGLFGDVNEKQREYLQDVIGSGQHLLSLINDILDLSKIEAGRMELELSTFDFRDALQSGVAIVRERASRHDITLSVTVADELGQVEADERKVKQVFYNLLSNAVKFTADGGRVDVTVRRDNGDVRVEVRDNGIGIAEADQARIFEEFQQVGRERSREGTGLGLTLTKRFVELHRGRIWVESAPGQGSTFAFTLPLRQTAAVRA